MTIVPIYAGIFALIYIYLAVRVVSLRRRYRVGIGHGGHIRLERSQRVHGNFAEYVPFALLLLFFVETQGRSVWLVHALCVALLAGRLVHAYGVAQEKENVRLRVAGMTTTFGVMAVAAATLLIGGVRHAVGV